SLASDWDPTRYHDTYTEELRDLIERKAKGEELTVGPEEELPSGQVIDLMAALRASLERGRPAPSGRGKKAAGSPKKARPAAKETGPAARKTRPPTKKTGPAAKTTRSAAKKTTSGRRSA